ncbi:unnamed protein product, partial [Porites evermanni]
MEGDAKLRKTVNRPVQIVLTDRGARRAKSVEVINIIHQEDRGLSEDARGSVRDKVEEVEELEAAEVLAGDLVSSLGVLRWTVLPFADQRFSGAGPDIIQMSSLGVLSEELDWTLYRIYSAAGPVEATVSLGPVQPLQCNGCIAQYSCDKLVPLQEKLTNWNNSKFSVVLRMSELRRLTSI